MLFLTGTSATKRAKHKPKQYAPLPYAQYCVRRNAEDLGIPAPTYVWPCWGMAGGPYEIMSMTRGTISGSTSWGKEALENPTTITTGNDVDTGVDKDFTEVTCICQAKTFFLSGDKYCGLVSNGAVFDTNTNFTFGIRAAGTATSSSRLYIYYRSGGSLKGVESVYYGDFVHDIHAKEAQLAYSLKSGEQKIYANGVLEASDTVSETPDASGYNIHLLGQGSYTSNDNSFPGSLYSALLFDSILSADQIATLYEQPYYLLYPHPRRIIFDTAGGTTVSISAASLGLTGSSISANQNIAFGAGSLGLTGQSVLAEQSLALVLNAGSLDLIGQAVNASQSFTIGTGSLSLTGQTALANQSLKPSAGSLGLTGKDALANQDLKLSTGSLSFNGLAIIINQSQILIINSGSATLTGQGILADQVLKPNIGSLSLSGQVISANQVLKLTNATSSFTGLGVVVETTAEVIEAINSGSLILTGQVISANQIADISKGSLTLTGNSIDADETVTPGVGSISMSGQALRANQVIGVDDGSIDLSGSTVKANQSIKVDSSSLTFTGETINIITGTFTAIGNASLSFVGKTIKVNQVLMIANGTLTFGTRGLIISGELLKKGLYKLGQKLR